MKVIHRHSFEKSVAFMTSKFLGNMKFRIKVSEHCMPARISNLSRNTVCIDN